MCAQMPSGGSTPTHCGRKFTDSASTSAGNDAVLDDALLVVDVVDEAG